jgi:hypothetical protein
MSKRMLIVSWAAVILIGALEFKQIHDTDIFWQVRLGEIMLDNGRISVLDRFTYTHAGEPVPPIGWLAQIAFGALHRAGGWHLARAVHNFAFVGALFAAAATCRRDTTSPFSVVVAMTIAFICTLSNADLRPQGLGLLSFAMLLFLARSRISFAKKLLVAGPLLVVWQNMHPSVVVGVAALAGLAAADFVNRRPDHGSPWEMVVLALLAMLAQFATPVGCRILDVSRANVQISRDVLHLAEWMPPWDPIVREAVEVYWVVLPVSMIAIVWFWNRISTRDRILFMVMSAASLYAARFIVFWAVASIPLWARTIELVVPNSMFDWTRVREDRSVSTARSTFALIVGAAIVLGLHPARFLPIVHPEIPLDGVGVLRSELSSAARIYNDYIWAGPLLLDGWRGWRVAVDGRLYFFDDKAQWRAIQDARAGRISLEELERSHHPDAFFLHNGPERALIDSLASSERWRVCYRSPTCMAFVRAR